MAMLKMLAPRASSPPSAKIRHCTMSTAAMARTAPLGPSRTAASVPPRRCPEVPPATGKLIICAAKTKAAVSPRRGTRRGGKCRCAWRRAMVTPVAARAPVATRVLASRNPSGMCTPHALCLALRARARGLAQAIEGGEHVDRLPGGSPGPGRSAHDVGEVLDHRAVRIVAAGHDLLHTAIAMAERERDILGPRGVGAVDGHRGLGSHDLQQLPFGGLKGALDGRAESAAEIEPARE